MLHYTIFKNPPANARDTRDIGSVPGSGRSPGVGSGNPFQCSCLENSMDRGAWQAIVHGIARVRHNLATKIQYELLVAGQTHVAYNIDK